MTDSPTGNIDLDRKGTGPRSWRVRIGGELVTVEATGKPKQFTLTSAERYRTKLIEARRAAEDAAREAVTAQRETAARTEREASTRVLNTAKRRLDGLTHEEASERFAAPPPILCVVSTRRQIVLVQGRTRGTYTLDRLGQVTAVEVAELDNASVIYSGTLAGLEAGGTKTKHAVKLSPWRRIDMEVLARHTQPQGVAD